MTTTHREHFERRLSFLVEALRTSGMLAVFQIGECQRSEEKWSRTYPLGFLVSPEALEDARRAGSAAPDVENLTALTASLERLERDGRVSVSRANDLFQAITTAEATDAGTLLERMRATRTGDAWHWLHTADLADEIARITPTLVEHLTRDLELAAKHWVHDEIRDDVLARAVGAAEWWPLPDEYADLEETLEQALRREIEARRGKPAPEGYAPLSFARWLAPGLGVLAPDERPFARLHLARSYDPGYERASSSSSKKWERIPDDGLPLTPAGPLRVPGDGTGTAVEHEGFWYRWTPTPQMTLADELVLAAENGEMGLPELCPRYPSGPRAGQLWHLRSAALARLHLAELEARGDMPERLAREVATDDAEGLDESKAASSLEAEAREVAREASTALGFSPSTTTLYELRALEQEGKPYPLDVKAAAWLRARGGETAVKTADHFEQNSRTAGRAEAWNRPSAWARSLATVLWRDVVRPRLEREGRWLSPALALQVYDRVTDATSKGLKLDDSGALASRDGKQLLLALDARVLSVGAMASRGALDRERLAAMGEDGRLLERGLSLVGSYNAHKLVRHVPRACLAAKVADPDGDFRVLRFDSYDELAEAAGMRGGKGGGKSLALDVRALAYVYDACRVYLDDGSNDRLWTRGEHAVRRGGRGRPSRGLTLTASPLLLPHTQERYLDDSRWLIPLVDVPPVVGREHAGQQAQLQLLVVRHMRGQAAALVKRGGVSIPEGVWLEMADRAGVPATLLPKVRERWLSDGDDGPAFLAREGGLYTLAPAYGAALAFLQQGGAKAIAGRKGGERAKAAKAARIAGKGPKRKRQRQAQP